MTVRNLMLAHALGAVALLATDAAQAAAPAETEPGPEPSGSLDAACGMSSLHASEVLSATGATHPRVTLDDIHAAIAGENYFTAGDAARALGQPASPALDLLTLCILTTKSGFTVIGKSAPASPENFDPAKGQTFAREDAVRQLWPLMGFAMRQRLSEAPSA